MVVVMIMVGRDRSEEVPRLVLGKESSLMALIQNCPYSSLIDSWRKVKKNKPNLAVSQSVT